MAGRLRALGLWLGLLLTVLGLSGAAYLYAFYTAENARVMGALSDSLSSYEGVKPTPEGLVALSHQVCLLDTRIGNLESFLQPVSRTIAEGGWCGNYVRVFLLLAHAQGYRAQMLHLRTGDRSHTMAEVFYEGRWRAVDPFFNLVYRRPDGELATYEDILRDPELSLAPAFTGELDGPALAGVYSRYVPIFPALFTDASRLDWRMDASSLYHTGILLLNYPLSLAYDGPRRAAVSYWLYRPELLGIYVCLVASGAGVAVSGIWLLTRTRGRRMEVHE